MTYDTALRRTPLIEARTPSGNTLWLKNEGAQPSGSFKLRGPTNFLAVNRIESGVVTTASTGNHAIGLSMAARARGYVARIMVPVSTPAKKLDAIKAAGGEVTLIDGDYEDALARAVSFAAETGAQLVPSYDHADIIAGNRGVFEEIQADIDCTDLSVFVPVGGGGLFAGALSAFAATAERVFGVELSPHERIHDIVWGDIDQIPPFDAPPAPSTEGVAIRTLGKIPAEAIHAIDPDQILSVSVEELRDACRWLWREHRIRAELGGCTALAAALRAGPARAVCVISGSNIDPDLHAAIVKDTDAGL